MANIPRKKENSILFKDSLENCMYKVKGEVPILLEKYSEDCWAEKSEEAACFSSTVSINSIALLSGRMDVSIIKSEKMPESFETTVTVGSMTLVGMTIPSV